MSQPASLRCAYARAGNYDLVWWIAAEEPTSIPDQFAALAARLGLGGAADTDALRDQVHDALRGVPGWLLIFDNADAADDIAPWLPAVPLPPGIPGDVIVTTRRAGFSALGQVLDLDVRDLAAAVRLLRSRVPDLGQDAGEQIAQELGRLPLALEQAAVYLELSQMPGLEYLEPLHSRAAELYTRGKVASHTDTVATLWDISLKRRCRLRLRTRGPSATRWRSWSTIPWPSGRAGTAARQRARADHGRATGLAAVGGAAAPCTTEDLPALYPRRRQVGDRCRSAGVVAWWPQVPGPVRAMLVEVLNVLVQNGPQVPRSGDQHPVGDLVTASNASVNCPARSRTRNRNSARGAAARQSSSRTGISQESPDRRSPSCSTASISPSS